MKIIFLFIIFIIFILLKTFETPRQQLNRNFHAQLLLKTIWFYLLSCLIDSVSHKPLFLPKTGKHDATLTSFLADVSELASFPFVRVSKIDSLRNTEKFAMICI